MNGTIEVSASEVEGPVLDWLVAQALGATFGIETFVYRGQHGTQQTDAGEYARVEGLGHFGSMWAAISMDRHAIHPAWRSTSDKIWRPSTDWSQGGPLLSRIASLTQADNGNWYAIPVLDYDVIELEGPTPLIAAMRAIVAAELGERALVAKEPGQ